MLGNIYQDVPYEMPDVKSSSELSEEEQVKIIERALHGDLQGIIDVTEADMDLYNRHRHGTETYANEYRRATEFSYVPKNKLKQVQEARARELGITPPPSVLTQENKPQTFYGNPVMNGYQSFTGTQPQYQYPNTYYQNPYNTNYGYQGYNYGYQYGYGYQQPSYNYGPLMNLVVTALDQSQYQYNNGYGYGGYYSSYYQPRPETFRFNPNQTPSQIEQFMYTNSANSSFDSNMAFNAPNPIPVDPNVINPLAVISMSPEMDQYINQTYYRNNSNNIQQQIQQLWQEQKRKEAEVLTAMNRALMGAEKYDQMQADRENYQKEMNKASYKQRHMYGADYSDDTNLTPQQKKMKERERANTERVMSYKRYNPYNILYPIDIDKNQVWYRYYNDKEVQARLKDMPPDMSAIDFINIGIPRYENRKKFEDFYVKSRQGQMGYDSNKYREILKQSGINATPYVGPNLNTSPGYVSSPDSITQRYNQRRDLYIKSAERRGDVRQ